MCSICINRSGGKYTYIHIRCSTTSGFSFKSFFDNFSSLNLNHLFYFWEFIDKLFICKSTCQKIKLKHSYFKLDSLINWLAIQLFFLSLDGAVYKKIYFCFEHPVAIYLWSTMEIGRTRYYGMQTKCLDEAK